MERKTIFLKGDLVPEENPTQSERQSNGRIVSVLDKGEKIYSPEHIVRKIRKLEREEVIMSVSRRNFIKMGTVGATALGLSGALFSTGRWLRPLEAAEDSQEKIAFTYHPPDCGGACSHKCTVRDGRLVKIEPNDWPDERYSLICLKGLSEVEHVYSPDRLQTPLKRVGKRGEGKFVPISWDEALTTIADKLKELKTKYGGPSILFQGSSSVEYNMPVLSALLGAQVGGGGLDIGCGNGLEATTGDNRFGECWSEINDWVNAKTIILMGINILETTIADAQFIFDAKEAGAKLISIDPNYTTTVAKSDQWIRIRPGTDPALLLGMVSLVLENKWYDEGYLQKNSSAPFLIRSDNQKLLHQNDSDATENNPLMVWDELSNSLKPYNTPGVQPRLEGEFTAGGMQVKTVLSVLKEHQKEYTAAWAASVTEIPEQTIRDLTKQYATGGPAVLAWGWGGPDKWHHADVTGHAGSILAALTGNIGRKGGAVGCPIGHYITWNPKMGAWKIPPEFKAIARAPVYAMRSDPASKVKAFINMGSCIQQKYANLNQTIKWLDTLELVVTIAPYHNTSVGLSDIVLPACTSYECEYDVRYVRTKRAHMQLQQKVIEPLHQSKSDFQIEKELAVKLGLDQYLAKTPEDYVRALLNSPDPLLKGVTVEALKANNGIMRLNAPTEPFVGHLDQVYKTPSGKLELYHEKLIEDNQALPTYEEPLEASPNNPLITKYPLIISTPHTKYRVHSQFMTASWINQFDPEPRVEMNPLDGKNRDLNNGDMVEVFNDRGNFKARCRLTEALRPGNIRIIESWWTKQMAEGNIQNVTNDKIIPRHKKLPYGPVIIFNDTLVEVKKA